MGTIRNQVVIVQSYDSKIIKSLRQDALITFQEALNEAMREFGYRQVDAETMVTPVMESYINEEYTFFINGDCSKLGWPESDYFAKVRKDWVEQHKNAASYIVLVDFGEGDYPARILYDTSCDAEEAREK